MKRWRLYYSNESSTLKTKKLTTALVQGTSLLLGSSTKLKGDRSSSSFATNADKEKQDVKKIILTDNETCACFLHYATILKLIAELPENSQTLQS